MKDKQDAFITIRVTPSFKERMERASKRKNISRSEFIKQAVGKALAEEKI